MENRISKNTNEQTQTFPLCLRTSALRGCCKPENLPKYWRLSTNSENF